MAHQFGSVGNVAGRPQIWYHANGRTNARTRAALQIPGAPIKYFNMDIVNAPYANPDIFVKFSANTTGMVILQTAPLGTENWREVMRKQVANAPSVVFNGVNLAAPQAPAYAAAPGGYVLQTGFDYPGNDLGNWGTSDVNFCKDRCNENQNCTAFVTAADGQGCWTKSQLANKTPTINRPTYVLTGTNPAKTAAAAKAAADAAAAVAAQQAREAAAAAAAKAAADAAAAKSAQQAREAAAAAAAAAAKAAADATAKAAADAATAKAAADAAAAKAAQQAREAAAAAAAKAAADAAAKAAADAAAAKAAADAAAAKAAADAAAAKAAQQAREAAAAAAAKAAADAAAKAAADKAEAEKTAAAQAAAAKAAADAAAAADAKAAADAAAAKSAADAKAAKERHDAAMARRSAIKTRKEEQLAEERSPAHVEKCLKTLQMCVRNASDSPAPAPAPAAPLVAPAPAPQSGKSNYEIEAYNADEGEGVETYEGEGVETYEEEGVETYVLEGAPYVSSGVTRMGVLIRILFAIFLILFVLYMSKQA